MSRTRHESASTSVPRMRPVTPGRAPRAWVWFLLLLVAAAGIRFAYLADVSDAPDIMNPILDSNWNRTQALRIAGGECLPDGPFWRPPGYQYFLAPLFMTARGDPLLSRIVQILLSAATCGLIYLIGRRVFGHGVGLLAGALAAAYQMSIYFSVELLPTTLEVFANALMLWFLLVAEEKRTAGWWIAGGALLGFSAIVRPTVLVFAVLLIIFVKGFRLWRGSWRPALALGAGALVVILPVTAINLVHGRDAVFIASQGGVNFYIGNGPYADGKTVLLRGTYEAEYSHGLGEYQDQVHLMSVAMAEQATGRGMKPSAIDRYWYGKAIESIRDGPGRFAGLLLRKLYYFWNSQETSNNRNIGLFIREHSPWLRWPLPWFGLIAPLGIVGLVAAWRRGRGVRLLTLFLLGQMIAVVLFFVTARFRMPAVMALLVFASYGVFWLVGRIRATDWARAALGVVSLAALLGVVHTGCLGVRRTPDLGIQYFNQAVALLREERVEEAAGLMRLVTRINPSDPMIHCALGSTLLRMDCYAEAEESYERALAIRPSMGAIVHSDLGTYLASKGDFDGAETQLRAALEADPRFVHARLNLAGLLSNAGRPGEALPHFEEALRCAPGEAARVLPEMALALDQLGRRGEAIEAVREALEKDRTSARAHALMAGWLEDAGDLDAALREWELARRWAGSEPRRAEAEERLRALE